VPNLETRLTKHFQIKLNYAAVKTAVSPDETWRNPGKSRPFRDLEVSQRKNYSFGREHGLEPKVFDLEREDRTPAWGE